VVEIKMGSKIIVVDERKSFPDRKIIEGNVMAIREGMDAKYAFLNTGYCVIVFAARSKRR